MRMWWIGRAALVAGCLAVANGASAHPVPFSYVDARLRADAVELTIVAHIFDLGHDLSIEPVERLLEHQTLAARGGAIAALLGDRLQLTVDGAPAAGGRWSAPEPLPERQSVRLTADFALAAPAGRVEIAALLFPYDPQHKTFLNVYEDSQLIAQAILDRSRTSFEYFSGSRQGRWAVLERFIPAGIHHILIGPDHLLFLVGLLLLGGTPKQLLLVVTAFTIAHSITLSLAALGMVIPPANAIEPAIALSVIYVGADNLLVSAGGRDTRAWVALAFGLIHGFGFANVLRDMDLPGRALGWTLFAFNVGVEIGQLAVVVVLAAAFAWIRSRSETAGRRLAVAGSIGVILAGAFWFVERVFFSGGAV